MEKLSLMVFSN